MMRSRILLLCACTLGCLALASCSQSTGQQTQAEPEPAGIHELQSLYQLATAPHSHDVRRPVRDERARALRLLAEKAEQFSAETASWESDARLISAGEPQRDATRQAIDGLRNSLEGVQAAARESDIPRLRIEYTQAMASYRNLSHKLGVDAQE